MKRIGELHGAPGLRPVCADTQEGQIARVSGERLVVILRFPVGRGKLEDVDDQAIKCPRVTSALLVNGNVKG